MNKSLLKYFVKLNIIVFCGLVTLLCGCFSPKTFVKSEKLNVVAVNFVQYDFAKAICGDKANVTMIIRPGAEVHGYEPSLSDIAAIETADVFIYNGGESDAWIERVLKSVDTKNMVVLSLMDSKGITLYEEESFISHEHNEGHDLHHLSHNHKEDSKAYDEHIWTSPKNAVVMADAICSAVAGADVHNETYYTQNSEKLKKELKNLDNMLYETVKNAPKKLIVVADRFPFLYMAKDYGIQYMASFSGCSPESDAGPRVVAAMIDEIKIHGINRVFNIELSNGKMADVICEHTGAKKLTLHSCQNVTQSEFKSGVTYCDLMKKNIMYLKEALY